MRLFDLFAVRVFLIVGLILGWGMGGYFAHMYVCVPCVYSPLSNQQKRLDPLELD